MVGLKIGHGKLNMCFFRQRLLVGALLFFAIIAMCFLNYANRAKALEEIISIYPALKGRANQGRAIHTILILPGFNPMLKAEEIAGSSQRHLRETLLKRKYRPGDLYHFMAK